MNTTDSARPLRARALNLDAMVYRSHDIDRDVDAAVRALAERIGARPGAVFRLFLEPGEAQLRRGIALPPSSDVSTVVLRTTCIRTGLHERLMRVVHRLKLDDSDLRLRVERLAMLTVHAAIGLTTRRTLD